MRVRVLELFGNALAAGSFPDGIEAAVKLESGEREVVIVEEKSIRRGVARVNTPEGERLVPLTRLTHIY